MLNTMNYDIDITKEPPVDDTARQYYFIEKQKLMYSANPKNWDVR